MVAHWYRNSLDESEGIPSSLGAVAVVGTVWSSLVFAHSAVKNRLSFKRVRVCTEVAAASCLTSCILVLANQSHPSRKSNAIISELLITGLLNWFSQVADNLVFYLGYAAATHSVPKWKQIFVAVYIIVVLSISWMTTYTVNPFFVNTNSETYTRNFFIPGQLVYTWGNVLYNFYFTIEFTLILYRVHVQGRKQYSKAAQIISIKCIIHFFSRYSGTFNTFCSITFL